MAENKRVNAPLHMRFVPLAVHKVLDDLSFALWRNKEDIATQALAMGLAMMRDGLKQAVKDDGE